MEVAGREKSATSSETARDRAGDKARMRHRDWPDLWGETEGGPSLASILSPEKELPSMLRVLRGTPEKGLLNMLQTPEES